MLHTHHHARRVDEPGGVRPWHLRLLRTSRVFRYRNPFAIVMQALEENGLLFMFAFSVYYYLDRIRSMLDEEKNDD